MPKELSVETWYDLRCDGCGKHRSTDFDKGMEATKPMLKKQAIREGWLRTASNKNLCPQCTKALN